MDNEKIILVFAPVQSHTSANYSRQEVELHQVAADHALGSATMFGYASLSNVIYHTSIKSAM